MKEYLIEYSLNRAANLFLVLKRYCIKITIKTNVNLQPGYW